MFVGPIILEISLSFPDFVDDGVVPPPPPLFFCCSSSPITPSSTLHVSYSTYLTGLPQFEFVTIMLHFTTVFAIAMIYNANTSYFFITYS